MRRNIRVHHARRAVRPRFRVPRSMILMLFVIILIASIHFWRFWFLHEQHQRFDERAEEIPRRRGGSGTSSDDNGELLRHRWDRGKWALRTSNHTGEVGLNGTDLVEGLVGEETYADEYLRDRTEEEEEEDENEESAEGYLNGIHLKRRNFRSFRAKKGGIVAKVQQNEADIMTVKWFQKLKSVEERCRTEAGSLGNLGAVISKSVDKQCEVFWDNDENGVPEHDSAVPKSDIQVDSVLKENVSSSGNDSDSKDLEACQQKRCVVQDDPDKQSLSLCEAKAVPEEMTAAESGKESMRELLQEEM